MPNSTLTLAQQFYALVASVLFLTSFLCAQTALEKIDTRPEQRQPSVNQSQRQVRAVTQPLAPAEKNADAITRTVTIYYPANLAVSGQRAASRSTRRIDQDAESRRPATMAATTAPRILQSSRASAEQIIKPVTIYYRVYGERTADSPLLKPGSKPIHASNLVSGTKRPDPGIAIPTFKSTSTGAAENDNAVDPPQAAPVADTILSSADASQIRERFAQEETRASAIDRSAAGTNTISTGKSVRAVETEAPASGSSASAQPAATEPSRPEAAAEIELTKDAAPAETLEEVSPIESITEPATSDETTAPLAENVASRGERAVESRNPSAAELPDATALGAEAERLGNDAVALNNLAVRLTLAARHDEASEMLRRAIAVDPTTAKYHQNLSVVYENMNKMEEARNEAEVTVELSPDEPSARLHLCGLELATGHNEDAVGCYESVGRTAPLDVLSQTFYGVALLRTGRSKSAVPVLEKASTTIPERAETLNALGVAYFNEKRFADAAVTFKRAVEIAPKRGQLRFNLAIAHIANRNKEGAISQYRFLKEDDPKLAEQLYRLLYHDKLLFAGDVKR